MAKVDVNTLPDEAHKRLFVRQMLEDVQALDRMITEGWIEEGVRRIGAEQELFLLDSTLQPVNKALPILVGGGYVPVEHEPAIRAVLRAAALTYFAGALASIVNIGRWALLLRRCCCCSRWTDACSWDTTKGSAPGGAAAGASTGG